MINNYISKFILGKPPKSHNLFWAKPPKSHNSFWLKPPKSHNLFWLKPPKSHNLFWLKPPKSHNLFCAKPPKSHFLERWSVSLGVFQTRFCVGVTLPGTIVWSDNGTTAIRPSAKDALSGICSCLVRHLAWDCRASLLGEEVGGLGLHPGQNNEGVAEPTKSQNSII